MKVLGVLLAVVAMGILVTATLMSMYITQESNIVADVVLTWDDVNAEDLAVDENISDGVGGNSYEFIHWCNYSTDSQEDLIVNFAIADTGVTDALGIYMTLSYWDTNHWVELTDEIEGADNHTFTAGGLDVKFKTEYVFDTYLEQASDYQYTLTITRAAAFP